MAWTHVSSGYSGPLPRPGWHASFHTFSQGTEQRTIYLKWDHVPTVADRNDARDRIIALYDNPTPLPTKRSTVKQDLLDFAANQAGLTLAQLRTALAAYATNTLVVDY
jgi:hypothetical protein